MSDDISRKFLVPVAIALRPDNLKSQTASQFVRDVKVHRFVTVAETPDEARDIASAAVRTEEFSKMNKINLADYGRIAAIALFPEDGEPLGELKPFIHCGMWPEPDNERVVCYQSVCAASNAQIADWYVRDRVHEKTTMEFDTAAVCEMPGDHVYLGPIAYPEARAIFHRAYMKIALREAGAELRELTARGPRSGVSRAELLACLEPSIAAILPNDATDTDVARMALLIEASNGTVRAIVSEKCGDDDEPELWRGVCKDWLPEVFQTYNHTTVGCGLTILSKASADLALSASLLNV